MSAKKNLVDAYHTWEKLTQTEGAAIEREDWTKVGECQQDKQGLQRQIIHLTEVAQAECIEFGQDPKKFESELRRIINALIVLENRNATLLAARKQDAAGRQLELDQVATNLRRVKNSYAPAAANVWNSYS